MWPLIHLPHILYVNLPLFYVIWYSDDSDIPPCGPGGLSRECVLRIPSVIVKGD